MQAISVPVAALNDPRLVHTALMVYILGSAENRPLRTIELAELTGKSRVWVSQACKALTEAGLAEAGSVLLPGGQAARVWSFRPAECYRSAA